MKSIVICGLPDWIQYYKGNDIRRKRKKESSELGKMRRARQYSLLLLLTMFQFQHYSEAQAELPLPTTTGYSCSGNESSYPCETYAFYRALSPGLVDLASIGDLFMVSRLMIARPSNISSPSSPLPPGQPLLVPLSCGCHPTNTSPISYANITYSIKPHDTFYLASTTYFQNLTTYQSVMRVNPSFEPTKLEVGDVITFPIFCMCPESNSTTTLISYVFQPSDTLSSVASLFGVPPLSITAANGPVIHPYDTIFVPVTRLPRLLQPDASPNVTAAPNVTDASPNVTAASVEVATERKGLVIGLGVGLGIAGFLLLLLIAMWVLREASLKKRGVITDEEKRQHKQMQIAAKGNNGLEVNLMADVSDCLDKYRVFNMDELKGATHGFRDTCLIQGSVYKGCIDGELYAIKKMKWNAYEELKILQKVNHGNLVKLEGFCIDPEDGNCYLIYEYLENGSLYSLLHENKGEKLSWKARLRIAIDVANGLQYIHEHTRPKVVHKDIKSSNILLDSTMRAKIANFGLAKSGCNAITMHIVGTQGYIAPEYIADGVVSTKMDVFSFGVVLLELVSGEEAINEEGNVLWAKAKGVLEGTEEQKTNKLRKWMDRVFFEESCSVESVMNVMKVAVACLNRDPSKRPSMVDIVYALCKSDDLFFDISEDGLTAPLILAR